MKNNRLKRKLVSWLFIILCLMAVVSGGFVMNDFIQALREEQFWEDLRIMRKVGLDFNGERFSAEKLPGYDVYENILPEYRGLYARNSDIVGWIEIEKSRIDFPVMQNKEEPEYYLRRDFDSRESISGTPFVDYRCSVFPRRSFNIILYGHYSNGDKLFRRLLDYASENWAADNKYIYFDTLEEKGTYEVAAAFYYDGKDVFLNVTDSDDDAYKFYNYIELDSKKGFERFLRDINEQSLYEADAAITPEDKILTVICCAPEEFSGISEGGRFVVIAKKVHEQYNKVTH